MNVFKLEAAIGLNSTEYQKGLSACGKSMSEMGDKIKSGAAAIGKVTAAGMAAGAAGVAALAKSAVSAYADYEQLVGGVEKLFGESSDLLMLYAKDAYKTAGMSVNAYMETVTGFAAALTTAVQAAGGSMDEAVEYADTAMQDMSDNANTFGTDIASIQTAYQGFAKQNYTMLDNLKLGYGGTKAEMERLIEDANKLRREQGINNELTIESYADIITAIHTVQTEMHITGTTSREASKTISGSIGAVKAAWSNLTIEMAKDDGDISGAFKVLGENVSAVAENMIPRIEKAIGGIGEFIVAAAPQITSGFKKLLPRVLPSLVNTAGTLISSVGSAVMQTLPELLTMGEGLLDSLANNAPSIFRSAQELMTNFANQLLNVDYKKLGSSISTVFTSAVNSITDFVKNIDFYKVGEDIADFLNAIDWQSVANSLFDLIAAGIKAIPDIAVSFFANADIGNLMTMIGLLGAPKLLGGLTDYISSGDGQEAGKAAGMSWSSAFMSGVKAFGLGWSIGTYLRNSWVEDYGEDTVNEKVYKAGGGWLTGTKVLDKLLGIEDNKYGDVKTAFMPINGEVREIAVDSPLYQKWAAEHTNMPKYGDGGRVTQPTIALVGEKEPETIVPDSKLKNLGVTNYNTFNIYGSNAEENAEEIAHKLADLSVAQQRAQGGAAWAR